MNWAGHYAFDLFFNSACSFIAGVVVVWATIRIFRINESRWKLFLLSLPFVKILWDLAYRGIPSRSIFYSQIDPLTLPKRSQILTIGLGWTSYGPNFNLAFFAKQPGGKQFTVGLSDYIFALSSKYLGHFSPFFLLGFALAASMLLLLRRLFLSIQFEGLRRKNREKDQSLALLKCGRRSVDVYISFHYEGTPFTGGVFKPYICIPKKTNDLLSVAQREAVIQHELGHVKQWDLLGTMALKALGDLFWFIPFYRYLSQKVDGLREILADRSAVLSGVAPEHLASALLSLQDARNSESEAVLYSALFRGEKILKIRIERLLDRSPEKSPRLGWNRFWIRIPVTIWTAGAVMLATFGGNHDLTVNDGLPPGLLAWFHYFKVLWQHL